MQAFITNLEIHYVNLISDILKWNCYQSKQDAISDNGMKEGDVQIETSIKRADETDASGY